MNGILIIAHGSRANETKITLDRIVNMVRKKIPKTVIAVGYMEFSDPSIEKGLTQLVEQGATAIKVVPYFLFEGIHIREDIPPIIAKFAEKRPGVVITIGSTLGADERLADILVDRIMQED